MIADKIKNEYRFNYVGILAINFIEFIDSAKYQ